MRYVTVTVLLMAGLFVGCGKIEDKVQDGSTVDQPTPPAANCVNLNENEYGCYGSDKVFHGRRIVDGFWSLYTQSNVANVGNVVFYDRYKMGYDFREDGTAFKRQQTSDYVDFVEWGVNNDGTKIRTGDGNTFAYKAVFSSDADCFEVDYNGKSAKLCNEKPVDESFKNAAGYYGDKVKFGNLTYYNFDAVGKWTIAPYQIDGNTTTVTLDANGTTSRGGIWGVSADGKLISIDGVSYLVYQYLDGDDSNCIAVFETAGLNITSRTWKLCKAP